MPYAELNGLNLYYEEFGRGETVLFLHSHFSRGLLAFSGQILPFSGKYRCLFPDFRGHGRSICDDLTWNSRSVALLEEYITTCTIGTDSFSLISSV